MKLVRIKVGKSKKYKEVFRCRKKNCYFQRSVLQKTIFGICLLPLLLQLHILQHWLEADSVKQTRKKLHLSHGTVEKAYSIFRLVSYLYLKNHSSKIGGLKIPVEIDECQIHRRKSNVGALKPEGWIMGGIQRITDDGEALPTFLELIPDRKSSTFLEVVQRNVEKGSLIITDAHPSYDILDKAGYTHAVVNHSEAYVDRRMGAHTQRIESLWRQIRHRAMPEYGCSIADIDYFLSSYLMRQKVMDNLASLVKLLCTIDKEDVLKLNRIRVKHKAAVTQLNKESIQAYEEIKESEPQPDRKQEERNEHLPEEAKKIIRQTSNSRVIKEWDEKITHVEKEIHETIERRKEKRKKKKGKRMLTRSLSEERPKRQAALSCREINKNLQ